AQAGRSAPRRTVCKPLESGDPVVSHRRVRRRAGRRRQQRFDAHEARPGGTAASAFTAEAGMGASHEEARKYPLAAARLFDRCRGALVESGFTIERELPAEGRIEASGGVNWKSFGEHIELRVEGATVHVRSSCKVSTTGFDFGRKSGRASCREGVGRRGGVVWQA